MNKFYELGNSLKIYVANGEADPLFKQDFFIELYDNVFSDEDNRRKAGIAGITCWQELRNKIISWTKPSRYIPTQHNTLGMSSNPMMFLYLGDKVIGSVQVFNIYNFGDNMVALGYIISPEYQGKGYGTIMLKFVSEYLTDKGLSVALGFRDGNYASERIAAKNNYRYLARTTVPDVDGAPRPMTYYIYDGKPAINESMSIIPSSKILLTNKWIEDKSKILSRVNPKMINLEEYVYLSTSINKPISLDETYFMFSTPHYKLKKTLKKEEIPVGYFALTDRTSKHMFDPSIKGDIKLNEFCDLVDSDMTILETTDDKTSMILGSDLGEIKVRVLNNVLLVEDYVLNNK